mmetsp:Transcript_9637/g.10702  ORF Transcript_9637/g.10702 Transcript_9637/m.10702 type:complete len:186 (-) Transcript_9637:346-903(-)
MKVIKVMNTQHGEKQKWENGHETMTVCLSNPWASGRNTCSLTDHMAKLRSIVMNVTRCCKHTGRTPPTEQEQILLLLGSITSTDPTLKAHITMVNSDPTGFGMRFEDTATNLMLADPTGVVAYRSRRSQKRSGASISSILLGRGSTGVNLCWYPATEFRELSEKQKDELMVWRNSDVGKVIIADG